MLQRLDLRLGAGVEGEGALPPFVIASGAKQSRPRGVGGTELDCRVATLLAMTGTGKGRADASPG